MTFVFVRLTVSVDKSHSFSQPGIGDLSTDPFVSPVLIERLMSFTAPLSSLGISRYTIGFAYLGSFTVCAVCTLTLGPASTAIEQTVLAGSELHGRTTVAAGKLLLIQLSCSKELFC